MKILLSWPSRGCSHSSPRSGCDRKCLSPLIKSPVKDLCPHRSSQLAGQSTLVKALQPRPRWRANSSRQSNTRSDEPVLTASQISSRWEGGHPAATPWAPIIRSSACTYSQHLRRCLDSRKEPFSYPASCRIGSRFQRSPLDNRYVWTLIWRQKLHIVQAGLSLLLV